MAVSLERDSGVGIIKLNNPPANAYDHAVMKELDEAIYQVRFDPAELLADILQHNISHG